MLTKLLRDTVQKITLPIGRSLARLGVTADHLTMIGFLVILGASYLISIGETFIGGLVLAGGSIFDMLDGAVARASQRSTKRGAFLDSTLDRASDGAVFSGIAFHLASDPTGLALALACLLFGFLTSYVRARAEGLGVSCEVGVAERSERTIIVAAGLVFGVLVPALVVLALVSAITVVQRFVHVMKRSSGQTT